MTNNNNTNEATEIQGIWDSVSDATSVEYTEEEVVKSLLLSLDKFLSRSKKSSWIAEMQEAAPEAAKQIAKRILQERKVYAGGIQLRVFDSLSKNIQLFRFLISSAIEDGVLEFEEDTKNIYLHGNNVVKGIRFPKDKKPSKKWINCTNPLGIRDIAYILESMPLYWDKDFQLKKPVDVNLINYISLVNAGIAQTQDEMHVPIMNDFRGRVYAKSDVGNYTSDKVQRHHLLIEGLPCIALDSKSSCIQLASIMLKDNTALHKVFTLGLKSHKDVKPYIRVFKKFPVELDKETKKKSIMQFTYGGTAYVRDHLGQHVNEFYALYAEYLPLVFEFRNACVGGWDENAYGYGWSLPDGFEVDMVCEKPIAETELHDAKIELEIQGKRVNVRPFWTINTPLQKGEPGSKGLGANIVHSMDAYVMRELVRRCHGVFRTSLDDIKIGDLNCSAEAKAIYDMWVQTNMISLNILNELKKGDSIPKDYFNAIKDVMLTLPKHKFYIKPIHDEFCCRTEFRDEMVQVYNCLLVELYQSTYAEYISKELNLNFSIGKVNPKYVSELFTNDYLLHED